MYSKICLKWPLKKTPKIGFQYLLSLNKDQKYCRMLKGEHSAILSTSIKLPYFIRTLVLSIFKWPLKTGFTVHKTSLKSAPTGKAHGKVEPHAEGIHLIKNPRANPRLINLHVGQPQKLINDITKTLMG